MIRSNDFGFHHIFINPSTNDGSNSNDPTTKKLTLVLFHGTGGNEEDLIFLGKELEPTASILSPRGKVLENGMLPRFFKRLSEGVFDMEDLKFRTHELADFIQKCSLHYKFDLNQTIAVGFSNGANIAASILLLRPDVLQGAILFRVMVPLIPNPLPDLSLKKILLSAGINDPIVSRSETEDLYNLFQKTNANITLKWQQSSHNLIQGDILVARRWISNNFDISI
ncbi:MAG: alpha/beta hydrolase [Deltaproteobacteria bacterium]|jgi:phospholipase/carboxylesterase|nr:alpha/beta hydrolase [Nitrososphaeraceae archaeon]